MRTVLGTVLGLLFVGGVAPSAIDQSTRQEERHLIIRSTLGQDLFQFYCATCHGGDAKGRPAKTATRTSPPDLTSLSRRNGGTFPRERVRTTIAGGGGAAHRWSDMPDWAAIFRGLETSHHLVEIRLANLVEYIESLQELEMPEPRLVP